MQLICKKHDAEKILATKQQRASIKIVRTAINAKSTSSNVPNAFFSEIIAATPARADLWCNVQDWRRTARTDSDQGFFNRFAVK